MTPFPQSPPPSIGGLLTSQFRWVLSSSEVSRDFRYTWAGGREGKVTRCEGRLGAGLRGLGGSGGQSGEGLTLCRSRLSPRWWMRRKRSRPQEATRGREG